MQLKRGTGPLTVDREIDVEITREEVISILSNFVKRKMAVDNVVPNVSFDDLSVVAAKDNVGNMTLTGITLLGVETLPLEYPDGHAPVKVQQATMPTIPIPVAPTKPVIKTGALHGTEAIPSLLPPALQSVADAAQKQAAETKE